MKTQELSTRSRDEMIDITEQINQFVDQSRVTQGLCLIYCPHTTAGVTINENADPNVCQDVLTSLDTAFPWKAQYRHTEGNSAAHVKSSLVGNTCHVIIENGRLKLGRWQSIFFCEFDGPRQRKYWVKIFSF